MTAADRAKAADAEERGQGICRTCLAPIWNEGGTVGHRKRETGWSDRIERGGDSLVCFKAVEYRHVPLTGREAAIYDKAYARGAAARAEGAADRDRAWRAAVDALAEEWDTTADQIWAPDPTPTPSPGVLHRVGLYRERDAHLAGTLRDAAARLRGLDPGSSEEE